MLGESQDNLYNVHMNMERLIITVLKKIYRVSHFMALLLEFLLAMLLGCMFILSFTQVVMRYVFQNSLTWSEELVRYLFVWLIFLGGSLAVEKNVHLRAGVPLRRVFSETVIRSMNFLISICIFVILIILIWYGVDLVVVTKTRLSTALRLPMGWVYSAIPTNGAIMMFFFLLSIVAEHFPEIATLESSPTIITRIFRKERIKDKTFDRKDVADGTIKPGIE